MEVRLCDHQAAKPFLDQQRPLAFSTGRQWYIFYRKKIRDRLVSFKIVLSIYSSVYHLPKHSERLGMPEFADDALRIHLSLRAGTRLRKETRENYTWHSTHWLRLPTALSSEKETGFWLCNKTRRDEKRKFLKRIFLGTEGEGDRDTVKVFG